MGDRKNEDLNQIDAQVRRTMTKSEYDRVCQQLQGALDAFTFLKQRAPDLVSHFFGAIGKRKNRGRQTTIDDIPDDAREALESLIRTVHAAAAAQDPAVGRPALRLVHGGLH